MIDPTGLSRAELEPVMVAAAERGDAEQVEAIRAELAARTWQGVNPYADADGLAARQRRGVGPSGR